MARRLDRQTIRQGGLGQAAHGAGGKPEGYEMCPAKQRTGHFGTRVQIGHYSGNPNGATSCPKYRDRETTTRLCIGPNEDSVGYFTEGVNKLKEWMEKQDKTNS